MPNITTVQVTQQVAPTPPTLQQTGCFVSQGATNLAPGASKLLTQLSDLTGVIRGALNLTSLSWSGGTVTATTAAPHGYPASDTIYLTIAGASPAGYNGSYLCTITGTSTFTYAVSLNPGTNSVAGTYSAEDVGELNAQVLTFFAQGSSAAIYVLELGVGSVNEGVAALSAYLTANPNTAYQPGAVGFFYIYVVPRTWDGNANFLALIAQYEATTSMTYFFVTTNLTNYSLYTNLMKDVVALLEAPAMGAWPTNALTNITWSAGVVTATTTTPHTVVAGQWFQIAGVTPVAYNGWWQAQLGTTASTLLFNLAGNPGAQTGLGSLLSNQAIQTALPATEFDAAAAAFVALNYKPSSTNRVSPYAYSFLFGVTPFPSAGLNSLQVTLQTNNDNFVLTGAQGGISNTILWRGTTEDGRDFTYWYSIDWAQINSQINVNNAVINGSNNPLNPLYYSQDGINRLQDVVVATMRSAVGVGLATGQIIRTTLSGAAFTAAITAGTFAGQIVVNAVPFVPYLTVNPNDFKNETYNGLSVQYIPNRGFRSILFSINVTDFVVA